jgi:phage replication-related protein YjqB (UPF0714/DUF867 family)
MKEKQTMSSYNAKIKKALSSQTDLIDDSTHCSVDPEKAASVNLYEGMQVRIIRNPSQYALYTVSETRQENPDNIVRMGKSGRQRVGTTKEFNGTLDTEVPNPTLTDAEAEEESEFVERLDDDGSHSGLVALAPHGGMIENYTDEQAERVAAALAAKDVSSWRCKGWKSGGGAYTRWHITSTEIDRRSFPLLDQIADRGFQYAVAFHGFGDPEILIGGGGPMTLKEQIRDAIAPVVGGTTVRIAEPDDPFNGDDPANLVNWLTSGGSGGIQIEQSYAARRDYWMAIADAVAEVFDTLI